MLSLITFFIYTQTHIFLVNYQQGWEFQSSTLVKSFGNCIIYCWNLNHGGLGETVKRSYTCCNLTGSVAPLPAVWWWLPSTPVAFFCGRAGRVAPESGDQPEGGGLGFTRHHQPTLLPSLHSSTTTLGRSYGVKQSLPGEVYNPTCGGAWFLWSDVFISHATNIFPFFASTRLYHR